MILPWVTEVSMAELARILQSPKIRKSYVFVSGNVSAEDLLLDDYSTYHFTDTAGRPVTLLLSPEVIPPGNTEEYEFVKLLGSGRGPDFFMGKFQNSSHRFDAVCQVIQSRSIYFELTDSGLYDSKDKSYHPQSDNYYPLVIDPLVQSPTKPPLS
jgi:hypothetical protein